MKMRILRELSQRNDSLPTAILRNIVSLLTIWIFFSGMIPNSLCQTKAMKASPHTFVVDQDDEQIVLKIKGDESDHWVTNQHDFTVIQDNKGVYKVAKLSLDEKELVPSDETVGNSPPKTTKQKDIRPRKSKKSEISEAVSSLYVRHRRCRGGGNSCGSSEDLVSKSSPYEPSDFDSIVPDGQHRRVASKSIGTLKNLVILLQFKDHKKRKLPSRQDIDVLMNSEEIDENLAPTGSLKMLYRQHSQGLLTIESEVTDWILLDNTEAYYANGRSGFVSVFHEALTFALDELEAKGFAFGNFDSDGDEQIDSITFLTSGYGAEWGSQDSSGARYEDRIWSHKWSILGGWKSDRTGVRITDYFVSPSLWGTSGNEIGRVGVIAHETGHFLDLPDLYDTDSSGNGLGFFCLMANSWGSDGSQLHPPGLSAWAKVQLGWTTPRTPSIGVENRVSRAEGSPTVEAPDQAFKIGDGEFGFPRGEYLLIEFRKSDLLIGGIVIYHVDEQQSDFDTEGYPNQIEGGISWPSNGNHYAVALSPADGKFELEQKINSGNSQDLYNIGQALEPSKNANGPFPNTDSYQNGVVKRTGVRLCITSDINGPYMTFLFADNNPVQPLMTRLSEDFENGSDITISFESKAKLVDNKNCHGSQCASINKSKSSLSISVESMCLTELNISFQFYSIGLKNGEKIILEYSPSNGENEDGWILLEEWTKGKGTDDFRNKRWLSKSVNLQLTTDSDLESSEPFNTQLRFRHTSIRRKFLLDNLKIEGRF
mmetsp:Transcript_11951/g.30318  ORF Transcript_11951/g.30318 Transcript_11951/m.30318 type:complete len:767 (-) Transcript_11951:168-2468(-)